MRFLSNYRQLRFVISRNGGTAKTVLKTSYDIVSLPYLLTYVIGRFYEEYAFECIGFSSSELTDMLLTMYPNDFAVSMDNTDLVIDDLETWERNCSSYDIIRTIGIFKPKELNLSEKLFCKLKKHCKQNGFLAVYAETNEESLIIFYRPKSNQRVFGIRRNCYSKNGNSIEIGLLINENTFLWFKTAAIVSFKKYFFSKLTKLHKRNSDRPQMYNLKGITSDGKVVEFPYISADKCGVINIKGLPVGTYKFTEVINETQQ